MNTTQALPNHPTWQKLLLSAEGSIGKSWSFYEDPEPRLFEQLVADYQGDTDALADQAMALILEAAKAGSPAGNAWAVLKEGATLFHHLRSEGYDPGDNWEHISDVLWKALEQFAQGAWQDFTGGNGNNELPLPWKQKKFVLDALLFTLNFLPRADEDRIERFFNCKASTYWKSFFIFWDKIWGGFQDNRENYFRHTYGYRNNHKLATYHLLAYRLQYFDTQFAVHQHKPTEAFNHFKEHPEQIPAEKKARREIYFALFKYLRESGEENSLEDDLALIRSILGDDDVFNFLLHHDNLPLEGRGRAWLSFENLDGRWKANKKLEHKILPALMAALKHDEQNVREEAIQFLQPHETELFKYLRYMERREGPEDNEDGRETFKRIARVYRADAAKKLLENISFTQQEKGKFLLATPRILEARWEAPDFPNHDDLLPVILATVNHDDPEVSAQASAFLKRKSAVIQERLNDLIKDLNQEDKASELIASAIEYGSEAALKAILEKCVIWVASDKNGTLVDRASHKARYVPGAVLALTNLLNNRADLSKEKEVRDYVFQKVLDDQQNPTVKRVFEDKKLDKDELDNHTTNEIYRWCYSLKERSKAYADIVASQDDAAHRPDGSLIPEATFSMGQSMLKLLMEEQMKEREIAVQKWITHLLGEMSDRWFFEDKDKAEIYTKIKSQLERLAIEPLSKRLPKEENLDIRENLVKILGNIGGRVAVDALVRTVTGEERERAARQELLSEYYLKPSKARSEEASILLNDAVDNAKKTMRLLQQLNVATFAMGVVLIMGGVIISVASQELGGRVTGVLAGLGGLAAILTQFLKDPLERIQRAMADLVQVQTAFTSFVWELNLNGTYIQSQYVAEGVLTDFDLRQTIGRIDHAMERTMHLIQVYADGQNLKQPPHLHYLVQNEGKGGLTVTLFGQSLRGTGEPSDKHKFQLAINHQPSAAPVELWTDQMVMFSLDPALMAKYNGSPRLWASLLLNGQETNALPVTVEARENPKEAPVEVPKELPENMPKAKS